MRTMKRSSADLATSQASQRRAQVADVQRPVGDGAKRPVTEGSLAVVSDHALPRVRHRRGRRPEVLHGVRGLVARRR